MTADIQRVKRFGLLPTKEAAIFPVDQAERRAEPEFPGFYDTRDRTNGWRSRHSRFTVPLLLLFTVRGAARRNPVTRWRRLCYGDLRHDSAERLVPRYQITAERNRKRRRGIS